eukprot:921996-Rhodomonas_salina.2
MEETSERIPFEADPGAPSNAPSVLLSMTFVPDAGSRSTRGVWKRYQCQNHSRIHWHGTQEAVRRRVCRRWYLGPGRGRRG